MTHTSTYTPATRTRKGMQPMLRPAMSFICDICGNARVKGNHIRYQRTELVAWLTGRSVR